MKPHPGNKEERLAIRQVKSYASFLNDVTEIKEREYKNEAQKKYRAQKLSEIVATYIKIYIERQLKGGLKINQIAQNLTLENVRDSIIGKAELDIALQDSKAKKEKKFLINPNKNNLKMSLNRYYNIVAVELCAKYQDEPETDER